MPVKCRECSGKGKYKCPDCQGAGVRVIPPDQSEDGEVQVLDCSNEGCGAGSLEDGMVWCDTCGGRGEERDLVLINDP